MGGFEPWQIVDRARHRRAAVLRSACSTGATFKDDAPDDDHPVRDRRRRGDARRGLRHQPLGTTNPALLAGPARDRRAAGCSCSPGATPAALGLLADISERLPGRPRRDHGPLLGLPGPRPDHRQPHRRGRRRAGRHRRDASSTRSCCWGSRSSRSATCAGTSTGSGRLPHRCRRGHPMPDGELVLVPARLARGARGAVVAPHHLATAAGLSVLARRRLGGRRGDRDERRARRRHAERLRDRWRRVLADLGRGRRRAGRAQRLGPGARRGGRGRPPGPRPRPHPPARAARDHRARRGPLLGRRAPALRTAVAGGGARTGHRAGRGTASRPGTGSSGPSRRSSRTWPGSSGAGGLAMTSTGRTGAPWRPGERVRLPALARDAAHARGRGLRRVLRRRPRRAEARGLADAGAPIHRRTTSASTRSTWGTPIATTTAASGSRAIRRTAAGSSRSSSSTSSSAFDPAGGSPVRRPWRGRMPRGSTSRSRPRSSRWPTATPT